MEDSVHNFYAGKAELYFQKLEKLSVRLKGFVWLRLVAFLFIFIPFFWGLSYWISGGLSFFFLIVFFVLVKKNIQHEKQREKYSALKKIADEELLALQHKFSHFPDGKEFLNTEHFFSFDLDLFGNGSLFQFLNRTATLGGYRKLATMLMNPSLDKTEIEQKQNAIKELSVLPNWRLHFLANGKLFKETDALKSEIEAWSDLDLSLKHSKIIRWLIVLVPLLTAAAAIPALIGASNFFVVLAIFIQWVLLGRFWKTVSKYFQFFGRKSALLAKYIQLLQFIEDREFFSDYLLLLQNKVKKPVPASRVFIELKSLVKEFEYRQNLLVGFVLNSVLLWDLRCVFKLWKWHKRNHKKLSDWLSVMAEFDALISLANFANNHLDFVFPEIHEGGLIFQSENLGHPLLHPQKRVCNNFEILGWSKVIIVTGANMAGKSTFLRTVGVNLVLARTGAPVCASKMKITPTSLYTNMRTTDSLLKDESYFFAELKRIKGVLDRLEKGEQIFVILDEMLKGTNSIDKLNGSRQLIRKLVQFKSVSLVATHDLKLSDMENDFPQQVVNKCFEITIEKDELKFDYKLSNGVTKMMNASFLMKKMGII